MQSTFTWLHPFFTFYGNEGKAEVKGHSNKETTAKLKHLNSFIQDNYYCF